MNHRTLVFVVKRDIQDSDEEAVRVKEQSILELGGLLAKTGQAAGNQTIMTMCQNTHSVCMKAEQVHPWFIIFFNKKHNMYILVVFI